MTEIKMTRYKDENDKYIKGIEDYVSKAQY